MIHLNLVNGYKSNCSNLILSILKFHTMPRCLFPADKITDEEQAKLFLTEYNSTAEEVWNAYTEASWAYNTDINEKNKQVMVSSRHYTVLHCI